MGTMRRRMVATWTGAVIFGAVTAVTAGSASAAVPVEPRPVPAASPTDRTLEMVSPVDTGGQPIDHVLQVADNEDGGVLMQSLGAFGDVQNSNGATFYRARRGATGWETVGLQPRPLAGIPPSSRTTPKFVAADAQLEGLIETTPYPYVPEAVQTGTATKVYGVGPLGAVNWLSGDALGSGGTLGDVNVGAVSPDGQRVMLLGLDTRLPRLYVRDGDRTVPVSIDPGGTLLAGALPAGNVGSAAVRAPRAMSDDGQTVAFQPTNSSGSAMGAVYVRRDALRPSARTVIANRSQRSGDPAGTGCSSGAFIGMSGDGRRVILTCSTPLTDEAPATGFGLYEYDVVTDELRYRSPIVPSLNVLGADRNMDRAYLEVSSSLWVVDGRGAREVVPNVGRIANASSVSRNGERLAFISDKGLDGGYGGRQMYVYDATKGPDGTLTCVSCRAGATSGGAALFGTGDVSAPAPRPGPMTDSFTADGSRFFFMSPDALTPGAPQGSASVYEFSDGQVRLLVAGSAKDDARFAGSSPDGTDVFVLTRQSLLPQDEDYPVPSLYSLRRGGGFPPVPGCPDCGPLPPEDRGGPQPEAVIGSQQNVPESHGAQPAPAPSTAKPRIVSRRARGAAVRLRIRVRVAGTLRVTGSGLRRTSRRVTRSGTYTVTARLTVKARRTLARRGKLRVRPRVRWTPRHGASSSARTTLTVKRTTKTKRTS